MVLTKISIHLHRMIHYIVKTIKSHVKDCVKINGKQIIKIPKKEDTLDSKVLMEIKVAI